MAERGTSPLDSLFAFGIDPTEGDTPAEDASEWPDLAEIRKYNADIRQTLDTLLPHGLDAERFGECDVETPSTAFLIDVAIEHRLMHAETLAYMINQLSAARRVRRTMPRPAIDVVERARIPAGVATLGVARSTRAFAWDNEHDAHQVDVPRSRSSAA